MVNGDDSAGAHLDDGVGERDGIVPIVRDIHHGQIEHALKPGEFGPQLCTELFIKARERLVEQQHTRLANDGSSESDTLLFSSGELVRVPSRERLDANECQRFLRSPASFGGRNRRRSKDEVETLPDGQVRPQGQILEHEPDTSLIRRNDGATRCRDRSSVEHDLPHLGYFQSGDDPEQRRLAAATRAENDNGPPGRHHKGDVVQRNVRREPLGDVGKRDRRRVHWTLRSEAAAPNAARGVKMTSDWKSASAATCEEGALAVIV